MTQRKTATLGHFHNKIPGRNASMRISWRRLSLAIAVAIALGTSVHSSPASSQVAVAARALTARPTITLPRTAPRLPEYTGGLRSIDELEAIYNRTYNRALPLVSGLPSGDEKAANDNGVPAITEADVKEICEPTSAAATSDALRRLTAALNANSYWLGRPDVEGRKDIAQDMLAKILGRCEEFRTGHYPNVPSTIHVMLKRHMIDIARRGTVRSIFERDDKLETSVLLPMLSESSRSNMIQMSAIEARSALGKLSLQLTDPEHEVLIGIASGRSTAEIAKTISIPDNVSDGPRWVRTVKEKIRRKLRELDSPP